MITRILATLLLSSLVLSLAACSFVVEGPHVLELSPGSQSVMHELQGQATIKNKGPGVIEVTCLKGEEVVTEATIQPYTDAEIPINPGEALRIKNVSEDKEVEVELDVESP